MNEPGACLLCGSGPAIETLVEVGEVRILQCPGCRLVYQDQRSMQVDLSEVYRNLYADCRPARSVADQVDVRAKPGLRAADLLAEASDRHKSPGRVLDIGCSYGDVMAAFSSAGWHASGLDLSPAAVASVRSRNMDCTLSSVDDYAPDGLFDAVVLSHVLEHCRDPIATLLRVKGWLAPLGTVHVRVPNERSAILVRSALLRLGNLKPFEHLFYFDADTLARVMSMAGLRCEIRTNGRMGLGGVLNLLIRKNIVLRQDWQQKNYRTPSESKRGYLRVLGLYEKTLSLLDLIPCSGNDQELCVIGVTGLKEQDRA